MNLSFARSLIGAARSEAERRNLQLAIAIVDAGGHLVAFERMDGVEWVAADVAIGKAYTAAAFQTPTEDLAERSAGRARTSGWAVAGWMSVAVLSLFVLMVVAVAGNLGG